MQAEYMLDYATIAPDSPRRLHLMARFTAGPAAKDVNRRPLNLSLVIDHSGSMAGLKLDYTRQAAQFLVQNLSVEDILSIVLYNDKVETLLQPEKVLRKDAISQRLNNINASGTTNLSGGWLEGCHLVSQNHDSYYVNRVILMSDGLTNRGVTDPMQLTNLAQQKYSEGISTTTMGLGEDFNEDLLTDMAAAGGGAFYFIESPEVAPTIFSEELMGLLNVVGQNLSVSVVAVQGVTVHNQLNAYPVQSNGLYTTFRLGDIFANEVKALILEIGIPGLSEGTHQIATLRFEYDELLEDSTERRLIESPVYVTIGAGAAIVPHDEVQMNILLLRAAQARKLAIIAADKGEYDEAAWALRNAAGAIGDLADRDPRLLEERNALLQQANNLELQSYDSYSRKSMHTQAIYSMTSRHGQTQQLRNREDAKNRPPDLIPPQNLPAPAIEVEKQSGVPPTHVTWRDQTYALNKEITRIGRASHNEIVLAVKGVSRFHCHIRREGDKLWLEDLGSTNGTLVGGAAISSAYPLTVGDVAYVCDEKLVFHDAPGHTVNYTIED